MKTFLRIQRSSDWYGSRLPVSIYIDGKFKGDIPPPAPGKSVDFELPGPGTYEVYFILDGRKSAIYRTPYISDGQYQSLEIELPEIPIFSWFFRQDAYGRLVPRSSAISDGTKEK